MDEKIQKGLVLNLVLGIWSRRKWLAILFFALSFSFAWGLASFLPNLYQSTAAVLVENRMVSETFIKSSVTGEPEVRLQTISQKILGRARLEEIINQLGLYPELRGRVPMEGIVDQMRRAIKLEVKKAEPNTDRSATIAFTVSYLGSDPQTVARVTNALISIYIQENQNFRKEQAARTAELLRAQLQDYRKQLNEQEQRIGGFKKEHGAELQSGVNLVVLDRLNTELRINNDRLNRAIEHRNALAKQLVGTDTSIPIGDPVILAARLVKLNEELKDLSAAYSDKYPDVVRVKAQIAFLKRQLADSKSTVKSESPAGDSSMQMLKKTFSDVDSEIKTLENEQKVIQKELAMYQQKVESAPKIEQELQEIAPDYLATKEQYNTVLKQYEEAQLAQSAEQQSGEEFRILDPAVPPTQPAAPNRTKLLLLGLMFSIGLAAGAVVFAEQMDTSFHTVDDLRTFTKVPVLTNIPEIVTTQDVFQKWWRFMLGCLLALMALAVILAVSYFIFRHNQQLVLMLVRGKSS